AGPLRDRAPLRAIERALEAGLYFSVNPAMLGSKNGGRIIDRLAARARRHGDRCPLHEGWRAAFRTARRAECGGCGARCGAVSSRSTTLSKWLPGRALTT